MSFLNDQRFARTLITSALPYANGYIHLGHVAGAYLPADIFTRFLRSCGEEVIHVSGSDEHGVAITISAEKEGVDPRAIIDKYHAANEEAFEAFGIDFDIFGRTSWPEHHHNAQEFFLAAFQSGYISELEVEQFYDPEAAMFLPDRYVEGTCPNCGYEHARGDQCDNCGKTYDQTELIQPRSTISGQAPELRRTTHLYFKLGEFQQRLEVYVAEHADHWRDHVVGQSRSWLKDGLGERAVTRDLTWGIDVPLRGFEGKKLYVWFDAPIGYITNTQVLAERSGDPDGWKRWWCDEATRYVAFIGKDNIFFHTLFFPALLMSYNGSGREDHYILPEDVPACEFLNLEGQKFSKSRNWSIDLRDYVAEHPADPMRYTLAANMPENSDVNFTWHEFQARTNNELADILGNFVNRTMQFVTRYFDAVVPPLLPDDSKLNEVARLLNDDLRRSSGAADADAVVDELVPKYLNYFTRDDLAVLVAMARAPRHVGELYRRYRFREAIAETMNLARAANKYFNDVEPWKTRKENPDRCATSLNVCLQLVRSLAILFEPVIPFTAERMWTMLGRARTADDRWPTAGELRVHGGRPLGEASILVEKVDDEFVEREVAKLGEKSGAVVPPVEVELKPEVTIDDVMKLDLRVATILQAERVKKSKKLVKLQIRIGSLKRQILAGISQQYEPDELVGRQIVVVANLKAAKLMGQESQGMLLAANSPEGIPTLVTVMSEPEPARDGYQVR